MKNMIDFEERSKALLKKRKLNKIRAGVVDAQDVMNEEDYKDGFFKLLRYQNFDNAYAWLYDQILCEVGLISEDDCYPMLPCTPEEIEAQKKETEENALTDEEIELLRKKGELPF